jgi:hypothetical protein
VQEVVGADRIFGGYGDRITAEELAQHGGPCLGCTILGAQPTAAADTGADDVHHVAVVALTAACIILVHGLHKGKQRSALRKQCSALAACGSGRHAGRHTDDHDFRFTGDFPASLV